MTRSALQAKSEGWRARKAHKFSCRSVPKAPANRERQNQSHSGGEGSTYQMGTPMCKPRPDHARGPRTPYRFGFPYSETQAIKKARAPRTHNHTRQTTPARCPARDSGETTTRTSQSETAQQSAQASNLQQAAATHRMHSCDCAPRSAQRPGVMLTHAVAAPRRAPHGPRRAGRGAQRARRAVDRAPGRCLAPNAAVHPTMAAEAAAATAAAHSSRVAAAQ